MPTHELRHIAEVADRAAFLLDEDDPKDELVTLAESLAGLQLSQDERDLLTRSARTGTAAVGLWLAATAARCRLAASGQRFDELPERLAAVSWAWGPVPQRELRPRRLADEDALRRVAALQPERAIEEPASEGIER